MLERRYDISAGGRTQPLPISALIQAANLFGCKIYIETGCSFFDVKNYEELKRGLQPVKGVLIFCFDGEDEEAAEIKFHHLLGGKVKIA